MLSSPKASRISMLRSPEEKDPVRRALISLSSASGSGLGRLAVLGQFDDVPVEVLVTPAPPPGFLTRSVEDAGAGVARPNVCGFDVVNSQPDQSAGRGPLLSGIKREMKVFTFGPRQLGVRP